MIRSGEWKYVYHSAPDKDHPAERELYNLKTDAKELRNLAADPTQKRRLDGLHAALVKELGEHPDSTEERCRADGAQGYGPAQKKRG